MLVDEFMTPDPVTLDEKVSITRAVEIMKRHKIRRIPVLRAGTLIGIVTDRDLRSAGPSQVISFDEQERALMPELYELLSRIKVKDIMSRSLITIRPEQTIVTAAQLMLKHRISGMPVVDVEGRLIGIITEKDIFRALVDFSGGHLGKTLFAFNLQDKPGNIKQVADVIRKHGGRLASILTAYREEGDDFRRVYVRIRRLPTVTLAALKEDLRNKFELLYMIEDDFEDK